MKNLVSLLLAICLFTSCTADLSKKSRNFKLIQTYSFPTHNENDSLIQFIDSSTMFLVDSMRFFKIAYGESFIEDDDVKYDSIKYYYLGFKQNSNRCLILKNLQDSNFQYANVDSFINTRPNAHFLDSAVRESVKNKKLNKKRFKKLQSYNIDIQGFESVSLYFDKTLKNLPYSLSPVIDSIFGSKLVAAELLIPKKDFPPNTDGKIRMVEIRLRKLDFSTSDSSIFYFRSKFDSFLSKINVLKL